MSPPTPLQSQLLQCQGLEDVMPIISAPQRIRTGPFFAANGPWAAMRKRLSRELFAELSATAAARFAQGLYTPASLSIG